MEKDKPIVWTELALQEYEETIDWLLKNWSHQTAIKFSELVEQKVHSIKNNPFIGTYSQYIANCRKIWVPPYHIIIYKISPDAIKIIRLFDGRQNPANLNP